MKIRIFKLLVVLALIGFAGLSVYAYFGDLSPERTQITEPVRLNAN
ncbi:hypothetical protein [Oceaniglobus ichthyenteri]|nr:hypothetical protein [Oceaniglobus ichthyenteri]